MKKYFKLESSPTYPEKYIITIDSLDFPMPNGITGSFGVLIARLMNLDYVTCLRYVRDVLGAEIIGKNSRYMSVYYDYTPDVLSFIRLLNARMAYVMNEQTHPYAYKKLDDGTIERVPFGELNENNA